jgi:hypothetical protein
MTKAVTVIDCITKDRITLVAIPRITYAKSNNYRKLLEFLATHKGNELISGIWDLDTHIKLCKQCGNVVVPLQSIHMHPGLCADCSRYLK